MDIHLPLGPMLTTLRLYYENFLLSNLAAQRKDEFLPWRKSEGLPRGGDFSGHSMWERHKGKWPEWRHVRSMPLNKHKALTLWGETVGCGIVKRAGAWGPTGQIQIFVILYDLEQDASPFWASSSSLTKWNSYLLRLPWGIIEIRVPKPLPWSWHIVSDQ